MTIKTVKVSEKGQIALPADIRREVGIERGDELLVIQDGQRILLLKSTDVAPRLIEEFDDLLVHAQNSAMRWWLDPEDDVWDDL